MFRVSPGDISPLLYNDSHVYVVMADGAVFRRSDPSDRLEVTAIDLLRRRGEVIGVDAVKIGIGPGSICTTRVVAGVGVLLAWAAGGTPQLRRLVPFRATVLLGLGLVLAAISAFVPLVLGAGFGESAIVEFTLPPFGDVKFVSVLIFDVGVYLVVLGMALALVRSVGADIDVEGAS